MITENDMLWEEIPELLVDDDETKTNNTNFEPPPEPLYCKLCEPDEKKPASLFCKECDCNLCDSCINDHNNFKLTCNHEMLLLKGLNKPTGSCIFLCLAPLLEKVFYFA